MSLSLCPITLREAMAFVRFHRRHHRHHRHHRPPQGGLFAIAAAENKEVVAVAIVGRPVARMLDDGYTAEVTRLASDGTRNACSILYAAAWRACRAMGYRRLVKGTTLNAAGWKCVGEAGGGEEHMDTYVVIECAKCQKPNNVCLGNLSDLTVPDVSTFRCDDCGTLCRMPEYDGEEATIAVDQE